jgi:hypothetical protein
LSIRSAFANRLVQPLLALSILSAAAGTTGCAKSLHRVQQKDREYLSDPVLQLTPDALGQGLESHNLPRREGSAGGGAGSGGGCGC